MKQRMTRGVSLLLAAALAVTMGVGLPAYLAPEASAVTQQQIDALKKSANDLAAQKKELQQQLSAVAADKSKALDQKALLERQIAVINAEIDNIQAQIEQYDQLIAEKEEELAQAQEEERLHYERFCARVRDMEEDGEVSYWAILFNSSDFSDLLDRFMMVEEIVDYDNAVMNQLIAIREQIKVDKAELEAARQEQQQAKQAQENAKAEKKAQEAQVDALISQIKAQEDELKKAEDRLRAAAAAMDAEIKKKEKELAAQLAAQGSNIVSEAGFKWPSYATVLTSLFGSRIHPITGKPNNHTGVDIAARGGSNILAAKSGIVLISAYNSSYGNYVVVDHGGGQTTLYAHMSKRLVSEKQSVKQGQTLGLVGSTGSSTGNHLHFEVRVNGVRQDPLNYFKGSTFSLQSGGQTVSYSVK